MSSDIKELHWLMDMVQNVDAGLVVLDRDCGIHLWNGFMANHSGLSPTHTIGKNLFTLFPEIPRRWFQRKLDSVFQLKTRSFITWEQRPFLLRFKNYRPITGMAEFMYQNITLIPLASADGSVRHVGVILYDVTDTATGKLELESANEQLAQLSRTDRLTGLNNRGHWEECLRNEFSRCLRTRQAASLVMFDIDHFKKVNDTHGHQAGDEVIRVVAQVLLDSIRATDTAGRYGGEEFGVILPATTAADGRAVTERIRTRIEQTPVTHEDRTIAFTVSLGIADFSPEMAGHAEWLSHADQALYQAKEGGRNQTVVWGAS
jgi:diguanylate cyclase (GGDEF)-like protein